MPKEEYAVRYNRQQRQSSTVEDGGRRNGNDDLTASRMRLKHRQQISCDKNNNNYTAGVLSSIDPFGDSSGSGTTEDVIDVGSHLRIIADEFNNDVIISQKGDSPERRRRSRRSAQFVILLVVIVFQFST